MEVVHADGIAGARNAAGVVVVIDVLRAFTVSAYALSRGASRCLLVASVDAAKGIAATNPDAIISAEIDGLPVDGIPISNSPTMVEQLDLHGKTLVQRSTTGVQAALAALASPGASHVLAASLVVARATARHIQDLDPTTVTLVATGAPLGHPEDRICAEVIAAHLTDREPPSTRTLLQPIYDDPRYQRSKALQWPGCPPSDMDLALAIDRFDFAMVVEREADGQAPDCATLYRR